MGSSGHAHGGSTGPNLQNMTPEERAAYREQEGKRILYEEKRRKRRIIIGVIVGIVVFILLIVLMVQCTKMVTK